MELGRNASPQGHGGGTGPGHGTIPLRHVLSDPSGTIHGGGRTRPDGARVRSAFHVSSLLLGYFNVLRETVPGFHGVRAQSPGNGCELLLRVGGDGERSAP